MLILNHICPVVRVRLLSIAPTYDDGRDEARCMLSWHFLHQLKVVTEDN